MDIEMEIRQIAKRIIMEEINNLSIRAVVREKIEDAGFDHVAIQTLIRSVADSYFRSAMGGNVENEVLRMFKDKINYAAREEIKKVIGSDFSTWRGSDKVRDALIKELQREVENGYEVSVSVTKKGE